MVVGEALLLLFAAGALGGLVNSITTEQGFHLPRVEDLGGGNGKIFRPGFLGNAFVGGLGGVLLVVLNTSLGAIAVVAGKGEPATFELTVGNLASAALVGVGGAQLLRNAIDKRFEQATRTELADEVTKNLTPRR